MALLTGYINYNGMVLMYSTSLYNLICNLNLVTLHSSDTVEHKYVTAQFQQIKVYPATFQTVSYRCK